MNYFHLQSGYSRLMVAVDEVYLSMIGFLSTRAHPFAYTDTSYPFRLGIT